LLTVYCGHRQTTHFDFGQTWPGNPSLACSHVQRV
jgi:hypothetical protein